MPDLLIIPLIPQNGQQWRYAEKTIITQTLTGISYFIDGYDGNKFDFIVKHDTAFTLINIKDGVEYKFNLLNDLSETPKAILSFSSSANTIKWKEEIQPALKSAGVVYLYKSGGIIFAEFKNKEERLVGLSRIILSNTEPSDPETNDIWIDIS